MHADDLLVIGPSPQGLQQSINVIKKHAEECNLKVIIFSGNGHTKNKESFTKGNEPLHIIDEQTYLKDRK